tara:strand:- start:2160 stop:2687 length:528 start_codon:yes stop_codon:yes gene_type:complete
MLGVNMKKREMDDSYWLTLQKRLLDSGFITIVVSPSDGKNYYRPTPRGIRAYKTVLDLTKRNKLFKGPRFNTEELEEFKQTSSYELAKDWLVRHDMVRPMYDTTTNQEKYELVEYGYEFFQLYSEAITTGPRNPGPKLGRRMGEAVLMGMFLACYAVVKLVADSFRKRETKRKRR